jgi:3'-phosphoadenosine 5'-phosphosulfate sulfotransferase (PAPS reductase)/FAD synthetase
MDSKKISQSKDFIRQFHFESSAVMCSFGKDSMALLHLIRNTLPMNPLNCHSYPVSVLHHKHPWFPAKQEFAESVIKSWALEVHDFPPIACGVKFKPDLLELVALYTFGSTMMGLPINTEAPIQRRDFVCGLEGWINRPKSGPITYPWTTVYSGHKSSDVDQFEGKVALTCDRVILGGVNLVFPLRHWTDDDVWDYIEENHIPYDKRRYQDRKELPDKWLNPDYIHACTACIDPRNTTDKEVFCPKLRENVPNLGSKVLQVNIRPDYVEKEKVSV